LAKDSPLIQSGLTLLIRGYFFRRRRKVSGSNPTLFHLPQNPQVQLKNIE